MPDSHLAHMALHDALTSPANRALLIDRLDQERTELSQHGGVLTVLLADLDELKPVNDPTVRRAGPRTLPATVLMLAHGYSEHTVRYEHV